MSNIFRIAVTFALGLLTGVIIGGTEKMAKPLILERTDTVVIDTSKIITRQPIIVRRGNITNNFYYK